MSTQPPGKTKGKERLNEPAVSATASNGSSDKEGLSKRRVLSDRVKATLRRPFSSRKSSPAVTSAVLPPATDINLQDKAGGATSANEPTNNLLTKRVTMHEQKRRMELETLKKMLDVASKVTGVAGEAMKGVPVWALPLSGVLGSSLKIVSDFLANLKKMVENCEGWEKLVTKVDSHQKVFNEQLERMRVADEVPDPDSPLLAPVKQYAEALEALITAIVCKCSIDVEGTTEISSIKTIMQWTGRFVFVEMEKEDIESHTKKLSAAVDQFKLALEIFTSFTVHCIKGGVDSMAIKLDRVDENVREIREKMIQGSEHKETINVGHITGFGAQHNVCLTGTRTDVLEEIRQWAGNGSDDAMPPIYCIRDVAGTGKSTIARTVVDKWGRSSCFAFFFSQEDSSVRNASNFCFFIKTQIQAYCSNIRLDEYWKTLSTAALELLRSEPIEQQWEQLVHEPLLRLSKERIFGLVIDALDECTVPTRGPLLKCLLESCSPGSPGSLPHIRVLLTTRNEEDLRLILDQDQYRGMIKFKTLLKSVNTNADVALYVHHRLNERKLFVSSPDQRDLLITRCNGLFIFASLACKLLQDAGTESGPLEEILERFTSLDSLYHEVLRRADKKPEYTRLALEKILGIILVGQGPLSITAIAGLLSIPVEEVENVVGRLGSVLSIGTAHQPIAILHATFSEFLVRRTRATTGGEKVTNEYAISKSQSNRLIAKGCLCVLLKDLKRDPCSLASAYGKDTETSEVSHTVEDRIQQGTTAALRYAASAWIAHIIPDLHIQQIVDDVRKIFHKKLLNWIELAAILKRLPDCMGSVHSLQEALSSTLRLSNCAVREGDVQWCRDILEFMQSNQDLLSRLPLQVYSSALTFTPRESQVYQVYAHEPLPEIVVGHPTRTSGTLVLMGHSNRLNAVTYSAGSELLVSAAYGGEIMVWDARTGAGQWDHTLEGEEGECRGVRVLLGSWVIVSVWTNAFMETQKYTRLYHLSCETKGLLCPAEHLDISGESSCISWAPSLNGFACGTNDGMVHLFTLGGQLQRISSIKAHEGCVASLSFAHDGITMASTSWDKTIKIWSVAPEGLTGPTAVWKHTKYVWDGAFSPVDSSLFAFGDGNSLHLYNIRANSIDFSLHSRDCDTHGMVYSHDGKQIAVRSMFKPNINIVNIVDMDQNNTHMTREIDSSHTGVITCLAFSPDDRYLVTGGNNHFLRIHDLASAAPRTTTTSHQFRVESLSFSLDGRWLASVDNEGNLSTWNVKSGTLIRDAIQTGMGVPRVAMSSDGSIVACASWTNDIRFWSTKDRINVGAARSLKYPKAVNVLAMAFSPGDTKLTMRTSEKQIVLIDMQITHDLSIQSFITINLGFDPRGMILAFHSSGDYICCGDHAWDLTNTPPKRLTADVLGTVLEETFPPLLRFDNRASPSPSISLGTPTRQVFYIPAYFNLSSRIIHDGHIALGADDGRVMVIDFTHLATEAEKDHLDHINAMGCEIAARLGESRLHEVLFSYPHQRKIAIRVDYSETESDSDPESSEGGGEDTEDKDGEDGEEAEGKEEEDGEDGVE